MAPDRGPRLFLVLSILLAVVAFLLVRPVLAAVVLALTVGHLAFPLYAWLERHLPRRWPAATLVLVVVAVALVGPFAVLAILVLDEARAFLSDIRTRDDLENSIEGLLSGLGLPDHYVDGLGARVVEEALAWLQAEAVPIVSLATEFLVSLLVFFILLFYVLADGRGLVARLRTLPAPRDDVDRVLGQVSGRVKAIVYGTVGVGLIQAAIATAGWWLLGLPAPLFWGAVILVLELVPVLGAFVVLVPATVWAFLQGDILTGVALIVLNVVMVGLVDDVLRPYLIGHRAGVHPALILLGIVGGLAVFGLSGLILGPLLMGLVEPIYDAWARPDEARSAAPPGRDAKA